MCIETLNIARDAFRPIRFACVLPKLNSYTIYLFLWHNLCTKYCFFLAQMNRFFPIIEWIIHSVEG